MKDLSHRQAREFLLQDRKLEDSTSLWIETHLEGCSECRAYAALVSKLRGGIWSPYRKSGLKPAEKQRINIEITTQFRRKKMVMGILKPVKVFAWAAAAVVFLGVIIWILPGSFQKPETAMPVSKPAQTKTPQATIENQSAELTQTPTIMPLVSTETIADVSEGTQSTQTYKAEPGYRVETETIEIDMDCDTQKENIKTTYQISTNPAEAGSGPRNYLGVELRVLNSDGIAALVWKEDFDQTSNKELYQVDTFSFSECEQFLVVSGWNWGSIPGKFFTRIYQWNGETLETILDVPESMMDLTGEMMLPQPNQEDAPAWILTTFEYGYPDAKKGTCDQIFYDYGWIDGEFVLLESRVERQQPCQGAGG